LLPAGHGCVPGNPEFSFLFFSHALGMVRVAGCAGSAAALVVVQQHGEKAGAAHAYRSVSRADHVSNPVTDHGACGVPSCPGGIFENTADAEPAPALRISVHNLRRPDRPIDSEAAHMALDGIIYPCLHRNVGRTSGAVYRN